MKLIIDTNRVMAGLLKNSLARMIILNDIFEFYAPDYMLDEIEKHGDYLRKKAKLSKKDFNIILYTLMENIELIPYDVFKKWMPDAIDIMKEIDIKDSPFIAAALSTKADGIWTEDRHFYKQKRVRVYSTNELRKIIEDII